MGWRQWVESLDDASIDTEIIGPRMGRREFRDTLCEPAGLKDAHGLMVERDRTRLVIDIALCLNHANLKSAPGEQVRHGGPYRPETDDERVVAGVRACHAIEGRSDAE